MELYVAGQNSVFDEDLLGSPSSVHAEDPDYIPHHSDASSENENTGDSNKRKRNKKHSPGTWKQNQSKQKRLRGVPYVSISGKEVSAKAMGPPCSSKFCQRASTRQCQAITEEQRQWIFRKIWAMNTWEERQLYITTLV